MRDEEAAIQRSVIPLWEKQLLLSFDTDGKDALPYLKQLHQMHTPTFAF